MNMTINSQSIPKQEMQPELLWQNIFNCLQQIQSCDPNHRQMPFDDFLKSLPNIYYAINQPAYRNAEKDLSQKPKPINRKNKSCTAAPNLFVINEEIELLAETPKSKIDNNITETLNAAAATFVPSSSNFNFDSNACQPNNNSMYKICGPFAPKHKARAKLNIYIPKPITKTLLGTINESFPNINALYYYLDISTALQMNDKQINVFTAPNNKQIALINFDLHSKDTKESLYAVVIPNDSSRVDTNKWLWKLDTFLTAEQIMNEYKIVYNDLPNSSRLMANGINQQLRKQMGIINNKQTSIDIKYLFQHKLDWNSIQQIGSVAKIKNGKNNRNRNIQKAIFNSNVWMNECMKSWYNYSAIPIIVYENSDIENSKHWIEWIKLVYVSQYQCFVGISFSYNENSNSWLIGSIYLDKGDIANKHRLFGPGNNIINAHANYNQYFDHLHTSITELQFIMNH